MRRIAIGRSAIVRSLLEGKGLSFGEKATENAMDVENHGPYKAVIVSISMPVISKSGRKATLRSHWQVAPIAGEGTEVVMTRRSDGRWSCESSRTTFVS